MKLFIEYDKELSNIPMPIYGTSLIDEDTGKEVPKGRYFLPNSLCLVDVDRSGKVVSTFSIPVGFVRETGKKAEPVQEKAVKHTKSGINEELFLKTVALLSGKETLDKIV